MQQLILGAIRSLLLLLLLFHLVLSPTVSAASSEQKDKINRRTIVKRYNPVRTFPPTPGHADDYTTPLQVGNGNFAFSTDITSLQTTQPFNTLSSWAWKNDSFPPGRTWEDIEAYRGVSWDNQGRLVQYDFGGADGEVEQWLISNPNRVNLGRIGLTYHTPTGQILNITSSNIHNATQTLDMWTGTLQSVFTLVLSHDELESSNTTSSSSPESNTKPRSSAQADEADIVLLVTVQTSVHPTSSTVALRITSTPLHQHVPSVSHNHTQPSGSEPAQGKLGIFIDFPWCDGTNKFDAPYVGRYDESTLALHDTQIIYPLPSSFPLTQLASDTNSSSANASVAAIKHTMVNATFYTVLYASSAEGEEGRVVVSRDEEGRHRYSVFAASSSELGSGEEGDSGEDDSDEILEISVSFTSGLSSLCLPWDQEDVGDSSSLNPSSVHTASQSAWESFWLESGFVDVFTGSADPRADELQRRIVRSRYLERVNAAGDAPPQEAGLVNNGWYGKFHLEMTFWHSAHWALWNNWPILNAITSTYPRFLPSSIRRAQVQQGWGGGARWGKMSDPSGRSAPGQINDLLIWQQPHPLVFAEYEYRAFPTRETLEKWEEVVRETAEWMVQFAWRNESGPSQFESQEADQDVAAADSDTVKTQHFKGNHTTIGPGYKYDLGPPMYVVSEDTSPNVTLNSAFELAYWRLGLGIALDWVERLQNTSSSSSSFASSFVALSSRQGMNLTDTQSGTGAFLVDTSRWREVKNKLAPLPTTPSPSPPGSQSQDNSTDSSVEDVNLLYSIYEGAPEDFWTDPAFTSDHPALVGLHGWLPPVDGVDLNMAQRTAEMVKARWNESEFWGWDFPLLALSSARSLTTQGRQEAISYLLHPLFQFDSITGMPLGGGRVATPYFPGSGGLLYAVGAMAAGWDDSDIDGVSTSIGQGTTLGGDMGVHGDDRSQRASASGFPGIGEGWNVRVEGMSRAI